MEKENLEEDVVIKCMIRICDYYNKPHNNIELFLDNCKNNITSWFLLKNVLLY